MPFQKGTVPPRLKGKGIPQKYIDIFIAAFNSALKQYGGDEGKAYRVAYAAMNKALRRDGYRKVNGKWKKESTAMGDKMLLIEAHRPQIESVQEEDGKLFFEGTALVDNVLSHNGYFYSAEFNDLCMENTNLWMAEGNPVTMYTRHSKATGDFLGGGEGIPVGCVAEPLYREGNTIRYKAMIAPTSEGRDMQTLIREGIVKPTSIRTYTYSAKPASIEGEDVMWLTDGRIEGIDFCERPGIEGAGVKRIFEEAPPYAEPQGKEADMDWESVTLEDLKAHCAGLLYQFTTEQIGPLLAERDAAKAQVEALQAEAPPDTGALEAEVARLTRELAVAQAAHGDTSRLVAARLREENVPEAALAERAAELRNDILNDAVTETGGGKGMKKTTEDHDDEDPPDGGALEEAAIETDELMDEDVKELLRVSVR